jgi:4-diphosphocytidyl-2-C-methyl-D-erythritol kinase
MTSSFAKINLGLEIPFRRPDGYHEIRSIFIKINFGDDFSLETFPLGKDEISEFQLISKNELTAKKFQLFENVSERGDLSKNILTKAYLKLFPFLKKKVGVRVRLTKRIPPEGGIGGGSSNAGSLLKELFPLTNLTLSEQIELAKTIGADVPFFLQEHHCIVKGIGEILEPIEIGSGFGVLAIPVVSLSTKAMYEGLQKSLQNTLDSKIWKTLTEDVIRNLQVGDWKSLKGKLENEFEKVAFQNHSDLKELKFRFLQNGAEYASLSGSGSCFYGLVSSKAAQDVLIDSMKAQFAEVNFLSFSI